MIGNDIVDLRQAEMESIWQRKGYLEKIFNKNELVIIEDFKNKSLIIWQLWSMKEAVYKIVSRIEKRRFFAPKLFECHPLTPLRGDSLELKNNSWNSENSSSDFLQDSFPLKGGRGCCIFKNQSFFAKTIFKNNYLHTIAFQRKTQSKSLHYQAFQISQNHYPTQSQTTHEKLISKISELANLPKSHLKIQKNQLGIPDIYFKNEKIPVQISMSHHGNWGGFAIKLNEDE